MPWRKLLLASWIMLVGLFLLTGCGARKLEVSPAKPLPPPVIVAPEVVKKPVQRPSWMLQPAVIRRMGPIWLPSPHPT